MLLRKEERLNNYFILKSQSKINGSVSKEQKKVIKKLNSNEAKEQFKDALNDLSNILSNVLLKYDSVSITTHTRIIEKLEKNKNIHVKKLFKIGKFPLTVEKLLIGNKEKLFKLEMFYYVRLTKKS